MSLSHRLLLYVLAALPVVWGNCPYWFGSEPCGAAKASGAVRPVERRCPCCKRSGDAGRPASPAPAKPDCDDCPMTVARRGSTPVPPSIVLPEAAAGSFLPLVAAIPPAGTPPVDGAARPPGAPPDPRLLDTVVLTI